MEPKKTADWQKAFRARMKDRGLVAKSVYILPAHSLLLNRVEKALRTPRVNIHIIEDEPKGTETMTQKLWTTPELFEALRGTELITQEQASVQLIDGIDPAIDLIMHEYGDLPIVISASGGQMFCSTTLWDYDQVQNQAALNEALLLMNPLNPLSNFGLTQAANGKKTYILFGELSASSSIDIVLEEVDLLARNTLEAAEGFVDQLIAEK